MNRFDDHPTKTCLIYCYDNLLFSSEKKGVAPLLDFYHQHGTTKNLVLVDRVIGKAAAMLAILCGVTHVYTPLISADALAYLQRQDIQTTYTTEVPYIINRNQTGRCPIESAVLEIEDTDIAYQTIVDTLQKLSQK